MRWSTGRSRVCSHAGMHCVHLTLQSTYDNHRILSIYNAIGVTIMGLNLSWLAVTFVLGNCMFLSVCIEDWKYIDVLSKCTLSAYSSSGYSFPSSPRLCDSNLAVS